MLADLEAEAVLDRFCWAKRATALAAPLLLADLGVDMLVTAILGVFLADAPMVTEELKEFWESFVLLGVAITFAVWRLVEADLADF